MAGPKKYDPPHSGSVPENERKELERAEQAQARMTPPLPASSPAAPGQADPWTPPPGEHPVTKNELRHAFNVNDIKTVVALVVVAVGTAFGAYRIVVGDARAQADAGRVVLEQKHEALRSDVNALREEMQTIKREQTETRQDLREFYKSWRDDKRSIRLDQPLDAGR